MPSIGSFLQKKLKHLVKFNRFYTHFSVELLLLVIIVFTVGINLTLRANSNVSMKTNQSLFFVALKNNPALNQQLVDVYESVKIKVASAPNLAKEVLAASTKEKSSATEKSQEAPLPTLSGTALIKPNPSVSDGVLPKRDIEEYVVQGGDTVSTIAASFGVSAETVLWENGLSSASTIKPGQKLKILPTSGVKHTVKSGESLYEIAKQYDADLESLLVYNEIEIPEHIFPGDEIIIPNGVKKAPSTPSSYVAGLQRNDYQTVDVEVGFSSGSSGLIWPMPAARKLSQGYWSRHRAIDVPCKYCSVVSSADGIVELSGWQGGYGYTIVVNHGNGLKTRYAHASKLLVAAGDKVSQGQEIMISGNTGRSTGPHLHFEVISNGTFLNPLNEVN